MKFSPFTAELPLSPLPCHSLTGSALALHCCKAHAKINMKIENSTPCKIVTHKDFNLKLDTRDYVLDSRPPCNFWVESVQCGLPPNMGNITLLGLFCCRVCFSRSRAQVEPLILTLNGSNDVFPPKEDPFGVTTMGDVIWGKYAPKTPQKGA